MLRSLLEGILSGILSGCFLGEEGRQENPPWWWGEGFAHPFPIRNAEGLRAESIVHSYVTAVPSSKAQICASSR